MPSIARLTSSLNGWRPLLALGLLLAVEAGAGEAKNVILMVADGAGYNTWIGTSMFRGRYDAESGVFKEVFGQPGWRRSSASTYPLSVSSIMSGKGKQDPKAVYDPAKAWDRTPEPAPADQTQKPLACLGYRYLTSRKTDSAAAATAMSTGVKTYNNAINWSDTNQPLPTLAELAKEHGKSVGAVTTVPLCHATPAALGGAHHPSREAYRAIAQEQLGNDILDVLVGTGNPADMPEKAGDSRYDLVGGKSNWLALKAGTHPGGWTLADGRAGLLKVVNSETPPKRLLGIHSRSQLETHKTYGSDVKGSAEEQPTLAEITRAALRVLEQNPQGFYLMVEGGAVDWANHGNNLKSMVAEMSDFYGAVEAVSAYLDAGTAGNTWDNTLVILVADHETGMLWGPEAKTVPFQPLQDKGAGQLPGASFLVGDHVNALVPVFCRGPGSEQLTSLRRGTDPVRGDYVDNTDIFTMMKNSLHLPPAPAATAKDQTP